MEVVEIVERVNDGELLKDIAKKLNVSSRTLSRKLSKAGYFYNAKIRKYEKTNIETVNSKGIRIYDKSKEISEKVENVEAEKNDIFLTENEIKFVKSLFDKSNSSISKFDAVWEKSMLPSRKPEKKTSYIISEQTFNDFRKFSEQIENDFRISQNELVEIALNKLMRDWRLL